MSAIENMGNPFEEDSTDLLVLDSKEIMDDTVVKAVKEVLSIGQDQCKAFVKERFQEYNRSNKEEQVTPVQTTTTTTTTTEEPDEG